MATEYSKILTGPSGETCRMFINNKDMVYNGTDVVYKGTDIPLDNSNYEIYGISGETYTIKQGKSGIIGFDTYGNTIPSNTPFMGYTDAMELYYKNNAGAYDVIPFNRYNINNTNFINEFTNDSSTQKVAICGHTYFASQPAAVNNQYVLKSDEAISFQEYLDTSTKLPTDGSWGFGLGNENTGTTEATLIENDKDNAMSYANTYLTNGIYSPEIIGVRVPYRQEGFNGISGEKKVWYLVSLDGTAITDSVATETTGFDGIYGLWVDITGL